MKAGNQAKKLGLLATMAAFAGIGAKAQELPIENNEAIYSGRPLKLDEPKYIAFLKKVKNRHKAKRAANKARNIQHQINKK